MSRLARPGHAYLALHDWPAPGTPRAQVLIVHGLGEHARRYLHVARRLVDWGFAVRAYDQYGHGASSGARGGLPEPMRLADDLAAVADHTRVVYPGRPLVLLGHSLGGLVAASLIRRGLRPVDALVLSSPALDLGLSPVRHALISAASRLVPALRVGNGLDVRALSHAAAVVRAYRDDPLVHDRIALRLARFLADEGLKVIAAAPHWPVPTLLLWAGSDRLVRPAGSAAFAAAAPASVVQAQCFDALYHELFNEREAQPVFDRLQAWLDARYA